MLQISKQKKLERIDYYQQILASSNAVDKGIDKKAGATASGKVKFSGDKPSEMTKGTSRVKDPANNQFNMRLQEKGASREEIQQINSYVSDLVKHADIKQEDMSDKFSLLKKVEIILHSLYERRKVFEFWSKADMQKYEKEIISKTTRDMKQMAKEEQELKLEEERELRAKRIKDRLDKPKAFGKIDM